jgi:uncharacterized membrane protein YgaE (UPF0421/DUF939 family)
MDYKEYLWYVSAGFIAMLYKVFKETGKSARYFTSQAILAIFISVFLAPAIAEYYGLTIRMASGLSGILVLFGSNLLDVLEKKLVKKLEEKIDKIDEI